MTRTGRLSGIMQPLFSLRSQGDVGVGDFGGLDAFFKYLRHADQRILMLLPLLPTAAGDWSPYATTCAFGLNPMFIHLAWLPEGVSFTEAEREAIEQARASPTVRYEVVAPVKAAALERAFATFEHQGASARSRDFDEWVHTHRTWVEAFALFQALSEAFNHKPWWEWPKGLATRDVVALDVARHEHKRRVRYHAWLQWVAYSQWNKVRAQAKARGVLLCGDEPFIVGADSSDAWCWPQILRRDGRLGVPPDDFSAQGQDWGLPWLDFTVSEQGGDLWFKARAKAAAATYDVRRIDHAVGLFRQYVRDATVPHGRFIPGDEGAQQARGERNLRLLSDGASVVAEDLGLIPRFVRDTLARLKLPGYHVMRWSREDGIYRDPKHYPEVSLVTTGTHDTESVRSWWNHGEAWEREAVCRTWPELQRFTTPPAFGPELHEALLRAALNAQSAWCILPWQDVFAEESRINTPGTVGPHNWSYRMRFDVEELLTREEPLRVAEWLARLTREARRSHASPATVAGPAQEEPLRRAGT